MRMIAEDEGGDGSQYLPAHRTRSEDAGVDHHLGLVIPGSFLRVSSLSSWRAIYEPHRKTRLRVGKYPLWSCREE